MGTVHVVEQGEHVSSVSALYGFNDYRRIWNDPRNADLKALRKDPNVLFPGDRIVIPDKEERVEPRATDQRHQFRLPRHPLSLRLKLERIYNAPISGAPCTLTVETKDDVKLTTNAAGALDHEIPDTAVAAELVVEDSITYKNQKFPVRISLPLQIGFLDPVEEQSGQRARLANLGYYRGALDIPDEGEFLSAIEEFQLDQGLAVDGKCGPNTQAKLKLIHGC